MTMVYKYTMVIIYLPLFTCKL